MERENNNSDRINKLFYWKENDKYVFSRTKFLTIAVTITAFIESVNISDDPLYAPVIMLIMCLSAGGVTFISGYLMHRFTNIDSGFYEGDLLEDVNHFLFYWYDDKNKLSFSTTKTIVVGIMVISITLGIVYILGGQLPGMATVSNIYAIMISAPILLIGYIIHIIRIKK